MLGGWGARMTSDKDELERALQENLQLRRELGAEAHKASGGKAFRLGWVLYWACLILAAAWVVSLSLVTISSPAGPGQILVPITAAFIFVPAFVLYGLGRAFRYVLSGE